MKRVWRALRAPRTAVWLIAALSVYSAVATAIPQKNADPAEYARWASQGGALVDLVLALGLERAFSNVWFFILAALLCASTTACSIDRTSQARRRLAGRGMVADALVARLRTSPDFVVELPLRREDALSKVAAVLARKGIRTRLGPKLSYAESRVLGLFGSPLFHWSLVALIVVLALGQIARWEGLIGVSQFEPSAETAQAYGQLTSAPLAPPHTGWAIRLVSVNENKVDDGVGYGWTPTVEVTDSRGRSVVQEVHANRPLRQGPLYMHYSDHGLAAVLEMVDKNGSVVSSSTMIFDFDGSTQTGTTTRSAEVAISGRPVDLDISLMARDLRGDLPRLLPPHPDAVLALKDDARGSVVSTIGVGESIPVGADRTLRLAAVGYYARMTVVRDWSVGWIYAFMGLATLMLTATLLFPYRTVWLLAEESGESTRVAFVVRQAHGSGAFRVELQEALNEAASEWEEGTLSA